MKFLRRHWWRLLVILAVFGFLEVLIFAWAADLENQDLQQIMVAVLSLLAGIGIGRTAAAWCIDADDNAGIDWWGE